MLNVAALTDRLDDYGDARARKTTGEASGLFDVPDLLLDRASDPLRSAIILEIRIGFLAARPTFSLTAPLHRRRGVFCHFKAPQRVNG